MGYTMGLTAGEYCVWWKMVCFQNEDKSKVGADGASADVQGQMSVADVGATQYG